MRSFKRTLQVMMALAVVTLLPLTWAEAIEPSVSKQEGQSSELLKAKSDFFSKMEMIENLSSIESLTDQDMAVVMKSTATLPRAATLEDQDQLRPANPSLPNVGGEDEK